ALISEIDNSPSTQTIVRVRIGNLGPSTVTSAKLRMQIGSASGASSNLRGRIHVAPCTWDEALLTWANKPAFTATVLNAPAGTAPLNQVVDFDITPAIIGPGDYCFAIDTTSADNADYNSREAATGRPQVILTTICTTCVCGNNVVDQPTEQCDGTSDALCPGLCQANCKCAVCGDNIVNTPTEQCDGTAD